MTRVVGYARVSTDEQVDVGVSLDAQAAALRAYCELRGLELVDVVVDAGVSAGRPLSDRDGGLRVLGLVERGDVSAVVAYKLDRLFRDCADALVVTRDWDRRGVALHLVDMGGQTIDTGSAMGRFFLTMMAGFAELERNTTAERTRAALAHKKARGERVGSIPYGRRLAADGRTLERDDREAAVVDVARELRADGLSLRKIAAELDRRGHRSRTGRTFAATQVRRMLLEAA